MYLSDRIERDLLCITKQCWERLVFFYTIAALLQLKICVVRVSLVTHGHPCHLRVRGLFCGDGCQAQNAQTLSPWSPRALCLVHVLFALHSQHCNIERIFVRIPYTSVGKSADSFKGNGIRAISSNCPFDHTFGDCSIISLTWADILHVDVLGSRPYHLRCWTEHVRTVSGHHTW